MIQTNGHTATLTVSTQAEADEWVPRLLAMRESFAWIITVEPPEPLPGPPASPWMGLRETITRRELVIDGATEVIDLHAAGMPETFYSEADCPIDYLTISNTPEEIAKAIRTQCMLNGGPAGIWTGESTEDDHRKAADMYERLRRERRR